MNNNVLYIATASWEGRFLEGARRVISEGPCSAALCFWFEDYEERTATAREQFVKEFAHLGPRMEKLRLLPHKGPPQMPTSSFQTEMWKRIFEVCSEEFPGVDRFLLDITTTPREALWIVLDLLTEARIPGTVIYHRACEHGTWCGCEPDQPHIVPKLGGISELDRQTKLLVLTGFDEDRSEHFISHFEPRETMILLQEGSPDEDAQKNRTPHLKRFAGRQGITILSLDSYAKDWGYAALERVALPFGQDANLVLASVGPKTSAVSLYRLHRHMPHSALVYSPCRDYNEEYSTGIADTLRLEWNPDEVTNATEPVGRMGA